MKITKTEYLDQQRRIVAAVTSDSWKEIPHVSYIYEPDVSEFFEQYKKLNATREKADKITLNTLMLKVISEGLKASPEMNAHISYKHKYIYGKIDTIEDINISMPIILPNNKMMTVSVKKVNEKNLDEISADIADIQRRAENSNIEQALFEGSFAQTIKYLKQGKISQTIFRLMGTKFGKCKVDTLLTGKAKKEYMSIPETERLNKDDIAVGTTTISNVGSLYREQRGTTAILEIIPPQVSAFSVGAITDKPVVVKNASGEKSIEIRQILPICIAFDHRALDFGETIPFMKRLDNIFENPEQICDWVSDEFKNHLEFEVKNDDKEVKIG
ncbi:MAG: 2-oxo acid dehydrogenase subunit E2 [Clostridia bacterium]